MVRSAMPTAQTFFPTDSIIGSYDTTMKDATPLMSFATDSDQMLFGPLDFEEHAPYLPTSSFLWDTNDLDSLPTNNDLSDNFSGPSSGSTQFDFNTSPDKLMGDSISFNEFSDVQSPFHEFDDKELFLPHYSELPSAQSSSLPIPIRSQIMAPPSFIPFADHIYFPLAGSPGEFVANHPLPRSTSPTTSMKEFTSFEGHRLSVSPSEISLHPTVRSSGFWDTPHPVHASASPRSSARPSPLPDKSQRQRLHLRRDPIHLPQSSSAPSIMTAPGLTRSYTRRAESVSVSDDRDATIRQKKRISVPEEPQPIERANDTPSKSLLHPPKLAPSAWQLYFTDWIQRHQASSTRKLNVAQAAKEAGQEYATLTPEEKEPYKRRSQAAKDARERELAAYMRTLTPDDIKRENAFRAAQRKSGKSRKSNIKDPNAPKKPLSAYFMFLQRIRSDPQLVQEVFGNETETTKQSVLAAAKWRSMTDEERKPFLAKAEQDKLDYEAARRLYEEGTVGFGSSINFSILPGSPAETEFRRSIKAEPVSSESESEYPTDDYDRYIRF